MTDLRLNGARERWFIWLAVLPVAVAAALFFLRLGARSYWLDEIYSVAFAHLDWSRLWALVTQSEANSSAYYVLLKLWIGAFGDGEFAVRTMSAILATGAVIVTSAVGWRLFGPRTGLAAGVLLAVNSYFVRYAQEARGYSLFVFLVTLSAYFLIRAVGTQQRRYYLALGLSNGVLPYVHFFGVLFMAAQAASLILLPPGAIRWRRAFAAASLTAALVAPLGVFLLTHRSTPLAWVPTATPHDLLGVFRLFTGQQQDSVPQTLLFASYGAACAVAGAVAIGTRAREGRSQPLWRYGLLFSWLFVPILGAYFIARFTPVFVPRYLSPGVPALVLLAAAGLARVRQRGLAILATATLLVLSLHGVVYVYHRDNRQDWRAAAQAVARVAQRGDAILFYAPVAIFPFEHYFLEANGRPDALVSIYPCRLGSSLRDRCLEDLVIRTPTNQDERVLDSLDGRHQRLWVILAHDVIAGVGWDSGPVLGVLERTYNVRTQLTFGVIRVRLYERMKEP